MMGHVRETWLDRRSMPNRLKELRRSQDVSRAPNDLILAGVFK